jgi:hypothetical protein
LSSCGIPHARNGADFFQWRSSKGIVPEKSCRKIGALQFGHRAMATSISFSATSGFCDTSYGASRRLQARGVAFTTSSIVRCLVLAEWRRCIQFEKRLEQHHRRAFAKGSALVRPYDNLHGVSYVTPFVGLFHLTLLFTGQRILGGMSDRRRAVPFKHLPREGVDLNLRDHGALS